MWFALSASGQTGEPPSTPDAMLRTVETSLCEVLRNPKEFNGKIIKVRARTSVNWEWGVFLNDPECERSGGVNLKISPSEPLLPSRYASLSLIHDDGFREFDEKSNLLCNGMTEACGFDYLEADFTGVLMSIDDFRIENNFGNGFGARGMSKVQLVMLQVANSKLHAVEGPLPKDSGIPTEIAPSGAVRVLTSDGKGQRGYCATETVQPNVVLKNARQVSGTVQDVTGAAFASTKFELRKYSNGSETAYRASTTDKGGTFDFGTVDAGEYRFLAPTRGWRQPTDVACLESDKCLLKIVLVPSPTDMPYAQCPLK